VGQLENSHRSIAHRLKRHVDIKQVYGIYINTQLDFGSFSDVSILFRTKPNYV